MFDILASPDAWVALLTLTFLEIVLGIDNIVFISIAANRLPPKQQRKATNLGLVLAMVQRIILLFAVTWLVSLKKPFYYVDTDWFSSGISGQALTVEITEGLLMDANDKITNRLLDFRDAEVGVSIDDFGTGYSSLSYLKQFDIDCLKIDQSFVRNLDHDKNDLALCEAIIVMAHKLGIKVIAEGVETETQHQLLKDFDCDYGQGYFYSRPVPADDFETLFCERPAKAKSGSRTKKRTA